VRVNGQPMVPQMLDTYPTTKKVNVLIGDSAAQIRFAERYLSEVHQSDVTCKLVPILNDEMVQGADVALLYRVDRLRHLELSSGVKSKIGIWSLDPIERGSSGANAIIRFAAKLLDKEKMPTATIESYGNEMVKEQSRLSYSGEVEDVFAAIWTAMYLLLGPEPAPFKPWARPWDNHLTWMPKDVDPSYRLNTLYRELVIHVFAREGDEYAARKFASGRFKPKEFKHLKNLKLPISKVRDSIHILGTWQKEKTDPYICALKIAKIWERS